MIESPQNDKIKHLIRLSTDNRFRKKSETFVVEGMQENLRALRFDYEFISFFICGSIFGEENLTNFQKNYKILSSQLQIVSEKVYKKIAYRGSSEGIIGIYKTKSFELKNFKPKENSSVIVVESVEKPGNLGAILRSCEAFGIDALIVTDSKIDVYNPNVIRSSVGCLFGMNIFQTDNLTLEDYLKKNQFQILTTFMDKEGENIQNQDLCVKTAILFGTENSGLSDFWMGKGKNISIPMTGTIDSLNLSNATAIACYEILRQKKT